MRAVPGLLSMLLLAACSGPPPVQPPPNPQMLADLSPAEFPAAARLLAGFDTTVDEPGWHVGDRALLGLRLRKHDETHRWLLLLTVNLAPEPMLGDFERELAAATDEQERRHKQTAIDFWRATFPRSAWPYWFPVDGQRHELRVESTMLAVDVSVHDADSGAELGKSRVSLPADLLGRGLLRAAQSALDARDRPAPVGLAQSDALVRPQVEGIVAMLSLLKIVQNDDFLASYFWQVVEKPSLFSVLTSFGIKVDIGVSLELSVPAAVPSHLPAGGSGLVVPVRIDVNDAPALFVDVLAADPRRPYALCGGMVAAEAKHPSRDDLHFDVALLAARRAAK